MERCLLLRSEADLSAAAIGAVGAVALAQMLGSNTALTQLNLSHNGIGDKVPRAGETGGPGYSGR